VDEEKIIEHIIEGINTLFPKKCTCCGKVFTDFMDFLENTDIPDHAHDENFMILHIPRQEAYEVLALRNCKCKSTIAIPCALDKEFKKDLIAYLENKAKQLGISPEKMAGLVRDKIIHKVLAK